MFHLTARVAWHADRWNGRVCSKPGSNPYCAALDKIREAKQRPGVEEREIKLAGKLFGEIAAADLPPCSAEGGAFMNDAEWTREFVHPYQENAKAEATHGHLRPTTVKVPPYSTFAVPFRWMLKERQEALEELFPDPIPSDDEAPFPTPWVFGRARQEALGELFFGKLADERSLVFFYCKEGQPLGDAFPRLVVGLGRIAKVGPRLQYKSSKKTTYPMWDRVVRHTIRPDGVDGFLLPYHDYLVPTGDPAEDARREALLHEIAVMPDPANILDYSYAAELTTPDVALATLTRAIAAVTAVKCHGIAKGPWDERLDWLNAQIATTWKDRGAFPGLGAALEALGVRFGSALAHELVASGVVKPKDDPWSMVEAMLAGKRAPPRDVYAPELKAARATWAALNAKHRNLLHLLSRFDLSPAQAKRWFDEQARSEVVDAGITAEQVLENPYLISELDLGDADTPPITIGVMDRGLRPDATVAAVHPVPPPSRVESASDERRVRAALVSVLRDSADRGDSLLSVTEAAQQVRQLELSPPCELATAWLAGHTAFLAGVIDVLDAEVRSSKAAGGAKKIPSVQLTYVRGYEARLAKLLEKRAEKEIPPVEADWRPLLLSAIGTFFDPEKPRHEDAVREQTAALQRITTRRLSVLVGKAGTGKTSVLGALLKSKKLRKDGILLLAPTGKARVRLEDKTDTDAMTVAQFLYRQQRYDGERQRPLLSGRDKYRKEKTVVIDECSMLTLDDLLAVLEALDLAHIERFILVGDPNQLPPIGIGRPFADLVAHLEHCSESDKPLVQRLGGALSRLSVEVRATANQASDTLRLASWFTREQQPVDADRVLSDLELGRPFNDLEIRYWTTDDELRREILKALAAHLQVKGPKDIAGFNAAMGLNERGWVPFDAPDGIENFQVLSPVRMRPYGVQELNRWFQRTFRAEELERSRKPYGTSLGDEEIVCGDKVIQLKNGKRKAFDGKQQLDVYLANGEIGTVAPGKNGWLNVVFAQRPGLRVGYHARQFGGGAGPLELAYALTVHKAQGSEFKTVFVIVPKRCRLLSRELLYTALTRSRSRLVLLLEGSDATPLYDLTRPEQSETARRNSNLFRGVVRESVDETPYAEHLIHRTDRGHMVRSKSELVIANKLFAMSIPYEYERPLDGSVDPRRLRPDFSFVDAAGDLILWEHLGMLSRKDYAESWKWKKDWYEKNGFTEGKNLFVTSDDERGGLDSSAIERVAEQVRALL